MDCYDLTPAEQKAANSRNPVVTTRAEFADALRGLGLAAGCRLVVHTAFSSLGTFVGGPAALCQTLMDIVTPAGTLLMPALSKYPADGEACLYDPKASPVRVGIVPETFRQMPGVVRSWDPTQSFCAWGRDSVSFVCRHHLVSSMDAQSPLGLLEQAGGYCLMIGCYQSATFMHVVETSVGCKCYGERTELHDARINGQMVKLRGWAWRNGECRGKDMAALFGYLRAHGLLTETMLHRSHLVCFRLADYRAALELQLRNPATGCAACQVRPRQIDRTVPTDWDAEHHCLLETDAFTGPYVPCTQAMPPRRAEARRTELEPAFARGTHG